MFLFAKDWKKMCGLAAKFNDDPPADPPPANPGGGGDPQPLIGPDGRFTDAFRARLPEALGEEHKDFKGLDAVHDPLILAKMYADTKSMVGKKLENVIQKPGENASDEEKAAYRQQLAAAIGVPQEATAYEFDKTGLPEGIEISEEEETFWKDAFQKAGVGMDGSKVLFDAYKQARMQEAQAYQEAIQQQFQAEVKALQAEWKGDAMIENPRLAYNAIQQFCTDELKDVLKNAGLYGDPSNIEKWHRAGFTPSQLMIWANIGKAMKSGTVIKDGGQPAADDQSPRAQAMRQYPASPELWPKE